MSVNFGVSGVLLPPTTTTLTTTNATDVFVPVKTPHTVINISVVNVDASNTCTLVLRWHDGTNAYPFYSATIAAAGNVNIDNALPLLLQPDAGDGNGVAKKITAQAGATNDLVVTVTATQTMPQQSNVNQAYSGRRG
jgi:hypothetical protein